MSVPLTDIRQCALQSYCLILLSTLSTERQRSPAAGSGSAADAGGSQVQCFVRPSFGAGHWFSLGPSLDCVSNDCAVEGLHAPPYEEALFGVPDKPNCTRTARATCCMSRAETLPMRLMSRILLTVVS